MASVLLISYNLTKEPYPVYPLGMAVVAQDLRGHNHEVLEWDFLSEGESTEGLFSLIKAQDTDVIGISMRNVDNCSYSGTVTYSNLYRDLVKNLRTMTDSTIVMGGSGYSLFPEIILEKVGADYGIVGEGERIFAGLIDDITSGIPPSERLLSTRSPLSGEMISAPERNPVHVDYYLKYGGMLNIQTKRGCPLRCAYCSYPTLEGRGYRFRPPGDVVDEIQMLVDKYKVDYYFIADSVFNDSAEHYLEICDEIVRRGIEVPWMAYLKPQRFRLKDVRLLKRSCLSAVEWGTDCSTDSTLCGMAKNFSWAEVDESSRLFTSMGIPCAHFIIFGGPDETEETVKEGLSNISQLENCVVFASTGVRVIPGTPIHQRAVKEGLLSNEEDILEPFFYFSSNAERDYIDNAIKKSFGDRIDRVYPFERDQDKIEAFHRLGYRGPVWDLLLGKRERRLRRST